MGIRRGVPWGARCDALVLVCAVAGSLAGAGRARADVLPNWGVEWGAPQRATASFGVLIGDARGGGFDLGRHLLLLQAAAGQGGGRVSLGWAPFAAGSSGLVFAGVALEATLLRTWGSPQGVLPGHTYAGARLEAVFVVKGSVGVLRRISNGGARDTVVTWSVGIGL